MKWYKTNKDSIEFYYKKNTFALYWPTMTWKKRDYSLQARTIIGYRPQKDWSWQRAIVFIVLGFGAGWAYNHCDNPNYIYPEETE